MFIAKPFTYILYNYFIVIYMEELTQQELTEKEKKKEAHRKSKQKWLTNPVNREKERLKLLKWRQENKDRIREYSNKWRREHPNHDKDVYDKRGHIIRQQVKRRRTERKQFAENMEKLDRLLQEAEESRSPIQDNNFAEDMERLDKSLQEAEEPISPNEGIYSEHPLYLDDLFLDFDNLHESNNDSNSLHEYNKNNSAQDDSIFTFDLDLNSLHEHNKKNTISTKRKHNSNFEGGFKRKSRKSRKPRKTKKRRTHK